jgi:multidrug efflux pump subunit AcrA (membrane-fusion protein)
MMKNKKQKRKKWPFILIIAIVLIAAAVLIVPRYLMRGAGGFADSLIASAEVTTGDVSTTVTGSGSLADDIKTAELPYGVTVSGIFAESGDEVRKGDVLATVKTSSVTNCISDVKSSLKDIDDELDDLASNDTETVSLKSKNAARVKKIYAAEGSEAADVVAENGALMLLSLDGRMAVTFDSEAALSIGSSVTVVSSDGAEREGKVLSAVSGTYIVTLSDDGTILGDSVTVNTEAGTVGSGTLYVYEPLRITADRGQVAGINVAENEYVYIGKTLLTISQPTTGRAYESLIAKRAELLDTLEKLTVLAATGEIYAPVSGTLDGVLVAEGASLSKGEATPSSTENSAWNNTGEAFTVIASDTFALSVSIDELDISAIETGQEASVEMDALEGETFTGTVIEVADAPEEDSGSSNYSATIEIGKESGMKSGMSATATILNERKTDVLTIPLAAVQEFGSEIFVYKSVDDDGNFGERAIIETGLSDGTTVEITAGLDAGDIVYYQLSIEDGQDDIMMFDMRSAGSVTMIGGGPEGGMPEGGGSGGPPSGGQGGSGGGSFSGGRQDD